MNCPNLLQNSATTNHHGTASSIYDMHTNFSTERTQCVSVVEVNTIKMLVVFMVIFRDRPTLRRI